MKREISQRVSVTQTVSVLRHIATSEFVCLRQNGKEFVACFTDGDSALQFREELGLIEFVDVSAMLIGDTPFENFWLDGNMIGRNTLKEPAGRL